MAIFTAVSMVFFIEHRSFAQTSTINRHSFSHFRNIDASDSQHLNVDTLGKSIDFNNSSSDSVKKYYVFRQLYGFVSRKDDLKTSGKVIKEFESSERFVHFAGKQIDDIRIIRLKTFGQSVYDTSITPNSLAEKFGNSLHITT